METVNGNAVERFNAAMQKHLPAEMSAQEWSEAMLRYTDGVVPAEVVALAITGQVVMKSRDASFAFVVRSLPVQSVKGG